MSENTKFNVVWFTGTEYSSHQTFNYSDGGPSGNKVINDISFDSDANQVLLGLNDPDSGQIDEIKWYRNKPSPTPSLTPADFTSPTLTPSVTPTPVSPTPSPTVTPTPYCRAMSWLIRDITTVYYGGCGDIAVPEDYDGDGIEDIAVFRPASGLWAIRGITRVYFGGYDDVPVPGDYTGDYQSDIGIFRRSSGLWAIKGVTRVYFGSTGD